MARVDVWQNTNGEINIDPLDSPYVTEIASFDPGYTLMRTRVDLLVFGTTSSGGATTNWAQPFQDFQVAAALCWSEEGPPASYYSEVFADWTFVQQVAWESTPYALAAEDGDYLWVGYYQNTIESRQMDSKSARLSVGGASLYLVIDPNGNSNPPEDTFAPTVRWTARCLMKQPAT